MGFFDRVSGLKAVTNKQSIHFSQKMFHFASQMPGSGVLLSLCIPGSHPISAL